MNKGFMVTPDNDGFDPDWASKPDANVVADDVEHWLHSLMADSKIAKLARDIVIKSRKRLHTPYPGAELLVGADLNAVRPRTEPHAPIRMTARMTSPLVPSQPREPPKTGP